MSKQYSVIFSGDVVTDGDIEEVKVKLAELLKEHPKNIDKLFSGQTFVIKRNADLPTCEKIRKAFIATGAVCHIKEPETQQHTSGENDDETLEILDSQGNAAHADKKKTPRDWKSIITSFQTLLANSKQGMGSVLTIIVSSWKDGSASIRSDMEMGGVKSLIGNKFVTIPLSVFSLFLVLLVLGLTYNSEVMPGTEANFDKILSHIEFIESAFTDEELESMTRNRSDFLDYVLVDPIRKMGYEFEPSIEKICNDFLDGDLNAREKEKVKIYLKITTHEREELLKHGLISDSMKKKLDKVAGALQQK